MITTDSVTINGTTYRRTCSDTYLIRKVGTTEVYAEAVDVADSPYTYEETDTPLPQDAEPAPEDTIAQLQAEIELLQQENAALLFENLTGEEFEV